MLEPVFNPGVSSVVSPLNNSASCDAHGNQVRPVKYLFTNNLKHSYIFNLSLATIVLGKRMQIPKVLYFIGWKCKRNGEWSTSTKITVFFSTSLEKYVTQG